MRFYRTAICITEKKNYHLKITLSITYWSCLFSLSFAQPRVELITKLASLPDDTTKVTQLLQIGQAFQQENADSTLYYFNEAVTLSKQLEAFDKIAKSLLEQGKFLLQLGDFQQADSILYQGLEAAMHYKAPRLLVNLYLNLSVAKDHLNDIDMALNFLKTAQQLTSEHTELKQFIPDIALSFSAIYFKKGEIDISNQYALKAIDRFKEKEDWQNVAAAYLNMSINFLGLEDFEKAESYGYEGLKYAKKSKNTTFEAYGYRILTASASELGKQDTALLYAYQSLEYWQELGNPYELGFSNRFIGKVLKNKGNITEAIPYLERSVQDFEAIEVTQQLLFSLAELGDGYIADNQQKKGVEVLKQVEQLLLSQPQERIDEQNLYKLLEKAYAKGKNFEQAYFYRKKHDVLEDTVQQKERLQQIQELETQYEVKEKEVQLAQQETQLQAQNKRLWLFGLLGLVALSIAMIAFYLAQERRKVNQQLRQLDRTKSNFFANVSHELRTPLTLILSPLENVLQRIKNQVLKEDIQLAHSNSQKLLGLVNEILDLSKLESGKMQLFEKPIELKSFLKSLFFAYESYAHLQHIRLNFQFHLNENIWVQLDVQKLEKILNNLISNALKYSPAEETVTLNIHQKGEKKLLFKIIDKGSGIDEADLPYIFDRFYQSQKENQQMRGGTGIGLALAREYARLMGGDLTVESRKNTNNKETIFSLLLPLVEVEAQVLAPQQEIPIVPIVSTTNQENDFQPQVLFQEKPKILIVEDHPEMSQFLVKILSPTYRCTTAMNGVEGLEKLEKDRFDLVTSDVMMPQMDGFTFLKKVHERELFSHTPVVMLTARSLESDKLRGFQLGVDDYITKPFKSSELLARIDNLLQNKQEREMWLKAQQPTSEGESLELSAEQELLQKAELLVIDNFANSSFKVGDLAQELNYSQRQLERIIKKLTGLTPNKFMKEIRLLRAMQLLEQRQFGTVAEVGFEVGFSDAAYFSRVFKKRFGVKPSEV